MLTPPIPADEDQRLDDLRRLDILLTTPEEAFDSITQELARIFEVSGVFMSFTDRDTQYFKSAVGLPPEMAATRSEPRELSVCSHVLGENQMIVVEDLLADDRFRDNPNVLSSGARFYAGTPLKAESGRAIGTLCIVDGKPRSMGDRERDLLRLIAEGVMAQVNLQGASRQLLERTKEIARDLRLAVQMQRFLLPPASLTGDGWRITYQYRPYEHLGGDFLGVHPRPDGRHLILVADVSGHGTTAALTTAMTKTAFHRAAIAVGTPSELLSAINEELVDMVPPNQFMTALAVAFDPARHTVTIASAGHPYPLLIRGTHVEVVDHENEVLLLLDKDVVYRNETTLDLSSGDRLLIYTDGAIEAVDPEGNSLDVTGLVRHVEEVMRQRSPDCLESLLERVARFAHDRLSDDVALLCIEAR